jgi:hypothetical protein
LKGINKTDAEDEIALLSSFSAPRDDTARASCGNGAKSDFLSLQKQFSL